MSASANLAKLNIKLPAVATPLAAYIPAKQVGDQISTSGQLPMVAGSLTLTGKVGQDVDLSQAKAEARVAALNALAAVAELAGGVDNIKSVTKVTVFVASAPDFVDQPEVANGASELFGEIFGDAGKHVRSAVGVAVLPKDAVVEVELTVQV